MFDWWVPLYLIELSYVYDAGRRGTRSGFTEVAYDALSGRKYAATLPTAVLGEDIDSSTWKPINTVVHEIEELWSSLSRMGGSSQFRKTRERQLVAIGFPTQPVRSLVVRSKNIVALPAALGLIEDSAGSHITVINRATGRADAQLTEAVNSHHLLAFVDAIRDGTHPRITP